MSIAKAPQPLGGFRVPSGNLTCADRPTAGSTARVQWSGWNEPQVTWGKNQARVGSAIHQIRQRLPFPVLGLGSDNGSEFIHQRLLAYCRKRRITFTRPRP